MATKNYSNGELTVHWDSKKCIHSAKCVHGLPGVFDPKARPWVKVEAATSQELADTIDTCPSGALSYSWPDREEAAGGLAIAAIEVAPGGPLLVKGNISIKVGDQITEHEKMTALCRCGASANKPYCDGSHQNIEFE